MKIVKKYANAYKELAKFQEKNKEVLLKNFTLEEKEKLEKFTLTEKLKMLVDENKLGDYFWEDENLEIKVKNKRITIFEKKRYAKKQRNL